MKNSIKRAQSQACLGFAERKNFRPLAKLKKLTLTLVALLSMTTGAWAQTENEVTVTPVTGQTNQWTFTMPAFDVELTPIYEPEFTAAFKAGNDLTIQGSKATVAVTEKDGTTAYTGATLDENGNYKPLYEGQTVTLTAAAGYKLKSVTAVPTGAANGAINAKFSISATKQVYFSKGNLQLVGEDMWQFAEHQYDYFGGNQSDNHRDLFGWGTGDNPNLTSTTPSDYATFTDWGTNMGAGWRTLTADEWTYLFTGRTSVTTRYCKAKVNGVGGVVLFPDTYTHPAGVTAPQNINPPATSTADGGTSFAANVWSLADWEKMEAAGCVLLPVTGFREGNSITLQGETMGLSPSVSIRGFYWSSSDEGSENAKDGTLFCIDGRLWYSDRNHPRTQGNAVRLVYDPNEPIEVTLNDDKTEAKFAMPGNDVTVNYTLVRDMSVDVTATIDDRIHIKKDGNDYQAVDATQMNPVVKDNLETNSPVTLTVTTDYTLQLQKQSDTNADEWTDATALSVGTFRYKITGAGNYSGICYSEKFALFEGYEIKVAAGEYATYYKDEALKVEDQEVELLTITAVEDGKAVLSNASVAMNSNTPFLVHNNGTEEKTILLIPCNEPNLAITWADEFIGTLTEKTFTDQEMGAGDFYVCNGKEFIKVRGAGTLAANKAYLKVTGNAPASIPFRRSIDGGEGTTGVDLIDNGKLIIDNDGWYDLNGRRLQGKPSQKGVYIKNGKKIVIK